VWPLPLLLPLLLVTTLPRLSSDVASPAGAW
jgi:hypothetical protein